MDSLSGILAFVRTVEAKSFAGAARGLGISASGVGKSISRLEAELGVRLLSRTTRRINLTDEGALFFEHCRKVLDELERARGSLSQRRATPRGHLRLSVPSTIGKRVVVPRLPDFLRRYPEVTLELSLNDRWVNLVEDGIDVAVRIGALHDSSLVARRLGQQQLLTVASPAYLRRRKLGSLADLAQHECLVFRLPTSGRPRPWRFQQGGQAFEHAPRGRLTMDEGEALVEAARAGLGIAQVPSYMAAPALTDGSLLEVLSELGPAPDPIHAVHVNRENPSLALRKLIEFLAGLTELKG